MSDTPRGFCLETLWDAMAKEFEAQTGPCPECWSEQCILTSDHERFTECGKCYSEWVDFVDVTKPQVAVMNWAERKKYAAKWLGELV